MERHLTLEQLAEETGISKSALGKYETDDFKDISPFSIVTLAKYYGVSTDYLLGLTETKNHPNTDLHDLHLGDDMIELLKSGKLNNRLLSELALHKDFQRFLVDIEIFVDRVADMRINDMNAILEANRKQIMEKHNPGENDLYVRTLELAQVSEENFFAHVVHKDIDGILHDIREAHRKDTTISAGKLCRIRCTGKGIERSRSNLRCLFPLLLLCQETGKPLQSHDNSKFHPG